MTPTLRIKNCLKTYSCWIHSIHDELTKHNIAWKYDSIQTINDLVAPASEKLMLLYFTVL